MPITIPALDNRSYQQLLEEALNRISVHTPEWTNFGAGDPGVTIIESFAFLMENANYRANLIPERNRLKFLSLLGIPLYPGSQARGFVTINNERGEPRTITLNDGLEVRARQVPFRTEMGLDVLPIEARVFYKARLQNPPAEVSEYYRQLYASYLGAQPLNATDALLYETRPLPPLGAGGVDLGSGSIDNSLWVALLLRAGDRPYDERRKDEIRQAIANRTLSLGLLPLLAGESGRRLDPVGQEAAETGSLLRFQLPEIPPNGELSRVLSERVPRYQDLPTLASDDVLARPGVVQIRLPAAGQLRLWSNIDPLEMGVGDFPPALDDTVLSDRLLTWLRISSPAAVQARFLWVGANATTVQQRAHVSNELLPTGTGEPDQMMVLSHAPVIPGSLRLKVTVNGQTETWEPVEDLFLAGPEVPVPDPRLPPGAVAPEPAPAKVFVLDPESATVRCGDGKRGARPPFGAILRADYDYGLGLQGNVGPEAINTGPALPDGMKVTNPVPTWGGAGAETVSDGERQITRYLQHRDRLVNVADFETITLRTPGVDVGRVEVLPAYSPELGSSQPGDAPGAVTLMLIPRYDPAHPTAPLPDKLFLDAVCSYLNPRRLVTTEVFLRPPSYQAIWVSIGITVAPRVSLGQVSEGVKAAIEAFLSPLPPAGAEPLPADVTLFAPSQVPEGSRGWPLRKPVLKLEVVAIANRVPGVTLVNDVLLLGDDRNPHDSLAMHGLELPYLAGIVVGVGEAPPATSIPGFGGATTAQPEGAFAPVPLIPEECR